MTNEKTSGICNHAMWLTSTFSLVKARNCAHSLSRCLVPGIHSHNFFVSISCTTKPQSKRPTRSFRHEEFLLQYFIQTPCCYHTFQVRKWFCDCALWQHMNFDIWTLAIAREALMWYSEKSSRCLSAIQLSCMRIVILISIYHVLVCKCFQQRCHDRGTHLTHIRISCFVFFSKYDRSGIERTHMTFGVSAHERCHVNATR